MFESRRRHEQQEAQRRDQLAAALAPFQPQRPERKRRTLAVIRTGYLLGWRFRRQLAPLGCIAGLWALGGVVDVADVPARGVAVLATIGVGLAWWLRYSPRLDRRAERRYALLCLTAATVWLVLVAALGLGAPDCTAGCALEGTRLEGVNLLGLLLIVGGTGLAAPFWDHHRSRAVALPATPAVEAVEALWVAHVAAPSHSLPGAELLFEGRFEHGRTYRVQLVPGRQSLAGAQAALPLISTGLRRPVDELVLERHPGVVDPSVLRLQVITASPIKKTVMFDAPRFAGGRIHLGPYADGIGDAAWRLYTRNSMWGGFVLGSIGSGKSRVVETIALTARAMGNTVILYVDGQDGASSSTLWRTSAMRAGADDSTTVLVAVENIMAERARFNVDHELDGFTPGPDRPGVLIVMDECHDLFPRNPERWANVARKGRKVGVAILAADQYSDLQVFGGLDPLRSSLLAGNGIALRTASRMAGNLIPGLALDPFELPVLPGYGYVVAAAGSDARTAPFRARYLPDPEDAAEVGVPAVADWFATIPAVALDPAARRAVEVVETAAKVVAHRKTGKGYDGDVLDAAAGAPLREPEAPVVEPVDEAEGATTADRIMAMMCEKGPRVEMPGIYNALPGVPMRTIRYALAKLVERGQLVKPGIGIYERAERREG